MDWFDRLIGREPQTRAALPATTSTAIVLADAEPRPDRGRVFDAPRSAQRPIDEALSADPSKIRGVLVDASYGRTRRVVDFSKFARAYDPRLNAVANVRVLAIGSRPFAIKPAPGYENDADAKANVAFVTRQLSEMRGFATLKQHLAHGILEPHAVLENIWSINRRGEWSTQPTWRHPNRFGWNESGEISKIDPGVDLWPGTALSQFPGKFIVHAAVAGQSDYPWMRGALRPLLLLSLAGRFGLRWWVTALERFGQPQVVATVAEGDQNIVDKITAALRNLSADWRAVVPEGVSFQALPVQLQNDLHQRFLDYCNTEKAIQLLGQNLSTEVKGGSYAAAKSQERVRADILAADLAEIDETLTDQLIRCIVHYNRPGTPVPYIEHTLESRQAWSLADYQAGLCTADEYRADTGHDAEGEGAGRRYFVPPQSFPTPAGPPQLTAGGAAAERPLLQTSPIASLTSSTSPSTTSPLASALLRR